MDDEPAICFAYHKLLESELFGVDICENLESAIAFLYENTYFAVISDLRFAGSDNKDGIYLVAIVKKEQPGAKAILITGCGNDELKKNAHEAGATHYFEKPVKPSLVISLLRSLHLLADEEEERELLKLSVLG